VEIELTEADGTTRCEPVVAPQTLLDPAILGRGNQERHTLICLPDPFGTIVLATGAEEEEEGSTSGGSSSPPGPLSPPNTNGLDRFPEWKPGDPITKVTPEGEYPKWYDRSASEKLNTIQGRYWMNRATQSQSGEFTQRQLRQMRAGYAPEAAVEVRNLRTGFTELRKVSKELHHAASNRGVPGFDQPLYLREVWPWEHASLDEFRHTGYEFIRFVSK
jgi:hypothetical protein